MEPDRRIQQMADDGVLDDDQAQMLRDSFAGQHAVAPVPHSGVARVRGFFLGLAAFVVLAVIVTLAGRGPAPEVLQDVSENLNQPDGGTERAVVIFAAIGLLVIVPLLLWGWMHNSMVAREEKVFEAWARCEGEFQRQASLILDLVETAARFLAQARETPVDVSGTDAKSHEALARGVDQLIGDLREASDLARSGRAVIENNALMQKLSDAQVAIVAGLTSILEVSAGIPELNSSDQLTPLHAQREDVGTGIEIAGVRFNETVGEYNATMGALPWSLVASASGFIPKSCLAATP